MNPKEKWALFSVWDKTGVVDDAKRLVKLGWKIISSGGTAKVLASAGVPVKDVSELVGGGAILGHRVVTLSREVHAALLADALKHEDLVELVCLAIPFIDLVRCDFYPLRQAIADPNAKVASVVELTDIGGPCMVRSGAKGLRIVVCRKQDMKPVLEELEACGDVCVENRQSLRARAEYEVAKYVAESAMYHGQGRFRVIAGEKVCQFKGENGLQTPAALFSAESDDPLALKNFALITGTSPSYNNWCDYDRLLQTMTHLAAAWKLNYGKVPYIAVGAKHGNPCGAAIGNSHQLIVHDMVIGDSRAIFGGVVMTNFPVTGSVAVAMAEAMTDKKARFDGVVAPNFDAYAIQTLSRVKGKCRLMVNPALEGEGSAVLDTTPRFRYARGGFLAQPNCTFLLDFNDPDIKVFGPRNPAVEADLLIAWAIGATSNSNTITIVKDGMLIGNGVGQQDRIIAARLARDRALDAGHGNPVDLVAVATKAIGGLYAGNLPGVSPSFKEVAKVAVESALAAITKDRLEGAVAYSDSFFPFPDAAEVLIDAGVKAIFSTSGSINDAAIQELCVKRGVTLYQLPDTKARGFFGH
ncbi:MAG: hypothetical protein NT155_02355 [Candidatus Staskawiczbacteria bacterium]|nr:hypothetical protein [Candidatus Staskawiczbacteria bacterium]